MPKNDLTYECSVCGYPGLDEPPYEAVGYPTYVICPSCGTEFGYHDANHTADELRQRWIDRGMDWHSRVVPRPANWNPTKQLRDLVNRRKAN
jgi:rubredoxin